MREFLFFAAGGAAGFILIKSYHMLLRWSSAMNSVASWNRALLILAMRNVVSFVAALSLMALLTVALFRVSGYALGTGPSRVYSIGVAVGFAAEMIRSRASSARGIEERKL